MKVCLEEKKRIDKEYEVKQQGVRERERERKREREREREKKRK